MGTKNNPGRWDCYANAHPDVQIFVLDGDDEDAPDAVRDWANRREKRILAGLRPESDWEKVANARQIAWQMTADRIKRQGDKRQGDLPVDAVGSALDRHPASLTPATATRPAAMCAAVRQGDELWCRSCGLRWGVDDHEPPVCPQGGSR